MTRPSHLRTPRGIDETCFMDCRYATPPRSNSDRALDILVAVVLGLASAVFLFFGLSS